MLVTRFDLSCNIDGSTDNGTGSYKAIHKLRTSQVYSCAKLSVNSIPSGSLAQ